MFFDVTLYVSLAVFGFGMVYKISGWFRHSVGTGKKGIPAIERVSSAIEGFMKMLFSGKIFTLIKSSILDVLFQLTILKDKTDPLVWVMHMLIFAGFILLMIFHVLGSLVFSDYQSTLNPFLLLRDFSGLLVIGGMFLAAVRRAVRKKDRMRTTGMDYYVLAILAIIVFSGFLLHGFKLSSHTAYRHMVEEYAETTDDKELKALEAFWIKEFGVFSPKTQGQFSREILTKGEELHEMNCAGCHSRPQSAFVSYAVSRTIKPIAPRMERAGMVMFIYYIHVLACFFGLGYLPFTKMFHIFATPVSLMIASVTEVGKVLPANEATWLMIELDGCGHGGACHMTCPVHIKRQKRIERTSPFSPVLDHLDDKSWKDLGCRFYGT